MILQFSECECSGNIMADFSKFDKVSDYLQAMLELYKDYEHLYEEYEFHPLDVGYRDKEESGTRWIIQMGKISPDAQKNINRLKRRRVRENSFISDDLKIIADGFERECFFSWG